MKRKLFSAVLGVFAMLLLMGAAAVPKRSVALLAEEESAVFNRTALETEAKPLNAMISQAVLAATGIDPLTLAEAAEDIGSASSTAHTPSEPASGDTSLIIDGKPAPSALGKQMVGNTTYVRLGAMAQLLDPNAQIGWDGSSVTVTTGGLSLSVEVGQLYMVANGRYLYIPEGVQVTEGGQVAVPLRTVAKAFGAVVNYDSATGVTSVTRGSGTITPGDSFYNSNDLFWLSRVIYRESGNQSLEGQMAVGNVIFNRIADPAFPDTVESVLAQKNQFTTYQSGVLAATNPSPTSIIAAKLVMDGGVVEETQGALFFDSGRNSWASRNKRHIATFGDHEFYG